VSFLVFLGDSVAVRRVWGLGFWILDLGFGVWGLGFGILDFGFGISDLGPARVSFLVFLGDPVVVRRVLDFGFWISDLGFRISDFGTCPRELSCVFG